MNFKDVIQKPVFLISVATLIVVSIISLSASTTSPVSGVGVSVERTVSEPKEREIIGYNPEQSAEDNVIAVNQQIETITLAGGCFWCIEAVLQETSGVLDAVSGYSGGSAETASYLAVAGGRTEHREVVQVTYDAQQVSLTEILNTFWSAIDPADAKGQFADRGFQYTTAIYYHQEAQQVIAQDSKLSLQQSGLVDGQIATVVLPYSNFFVAEEYHQDYYQKSAEHYKRYERGSGRAGFVEETWARDAAIAYFEEQKQTAVGESTP